MEAALRDVLAWHKALARLAKGPARATRWVSSEMVLAWLAERPADQGALAALLRQPALASMLAARPLAERRAVQAWQAAAQADPATLAQGLNSAHLKAETRDCQALFDTVERSPLTTEQIEAVVCFDNRVLVVAAAGSGKTSTMVAKAAYALHRQLVAPERILMLAFNADAARELHSRVRERLAPLGLDGAAVVTRTFHAFGLELLAQAAQRSASTPPRLAPWLEGGGDLDKLAELVDTLKDRDAAFRTNWDLFRVVFSRDLPAPGKEADDHEDWRTDSAGKQTTGFRTLSGEVVDSQGERVIADWLFYNGVAYSYAPEVDGDMAGAEPEPPEFYYPAVQLYHQHRAGGGADGERAKCQARRAKSAPAQRADGRSVRVETTSASLRSGEAFAVLAAELTAKGIVLDPNPDRPVPGRKVTEHMELVKVFRAFLTHAKSNRLDAAALRRRLARSPATAFIYRHQLFLGLFEQVRTAWQQTLAAGPHIDFEDMLNLATDQLEAGTVAADFELVMVDEFQDASSGRARLCRALVRQPHRHLFAVGDDWQSINRFAGADLSVMTEFSDWFGASRTLRLERTFRCPQALCDVSSAFVMKNPLQLAKAVASNQPAFAHPLRVFEVVDDDALAGAVDTYLRALYQAIASGKVARPAGRPLSVFILGRYRRDQQYVPAGWQAAYGDRLTVSFATVHASKGLEADYVILPRVTSGAYGFPSTMEDDPVLHLAMPSGDDFAHAEERRLFYVALTRARRTVALFTVKRRMSPFTVELVKEGLAELVGINGQVVKSAPCPACGKGLIVEKTGKHGAFFGCNTYPACKHTSKTVRNPPPGA